MASQRTELLRLFETNTVDRRAENWPDYKEKIAGLLPTFEALANNPRAAAIPSLIQRFMIAATASPSLADCIASRLRLEVNNGSGEWLRPIKMTLTEETLFYFDIYHENDGYLDAGDKRQVSYLTSSLIHNSTASGLRGECALSGPSDLLLDCNPPEPNLPGVQQTKIFSKNDHIPATERYSRSGARSLPLDLNLVCRLNGALIAITEQEREGKTWRKLPTETGDGSDLFIAFIASSPEADTAKNLSEVKDEEDDDDDLGVEASHMEHAASRLVRFWKGIADKAIPGERARFLILRAVDTRNRKAVYSCFPSVVALHNAAREWSLAMKNAPDWIVFTLFKDNQAIQGRPRLQAPLSLTSLSRRLYIRGGNEALVAPGVPGSEALALYLNEGNRLKRAGQILRLLLERHTMLVAITQAKSANKLKDFDPKATVRLDALKTVSWIGALLFFLGRTKETYMEDAGFKLGQLLSATDVVHLGYCILVRDGAIPPTLVGNSVFAAAGRNPDRALDVLQTRWKPYHAWATKVAASHRDKPADDKAWAVARAVSQARHAKQLCEALQPALARMRQEGRPPDEAFRAELLLGYVAGVKPDKKPDGIESKNGETAV